MNWILTSDKMPKPRQSVLLSVNSKYGDWVGEGCYWETTENHVIWKGYRWNATYWDDEIIAWMPLPMSYRKTEPQTADCPFDDAIPCEWVCTEYGKCKYKPKTEPTSSKMEQVEGEPQVVMPKKCKGCDSALKIIEAYSRGFEDGAEAAKAMPQTDCNGCKFVGTYDTEFPCANCSRKTKDYYAKTEPMKTTDYCDICKRDMCKICVADGTNPYCVPSHYEINYEPKTEQTEGASR